MNLMQTNKHHAETNAQRLNAAKDGGSGILVGIWHWINGVASGVGHFISGPVESALRAIEVAVREVVAGWHEFADTLARLTVWWELYVIHQIRDWINSQIARIYGVIARDKRYLIGLIQVTAQYVLVYAVRLIRAERLARVRAIKRAEVQARAEIRAVHHVIEREASSGYRITRDQRLSIIIKLLDFAVLRDPLLKDLVSAITTGILDLVAVDDPPARLLLGFLIKHVIDRLGIDEAVGTLARDLLAPILGEPNPRDIHDVIADLSDRTGALEQQWAKFFADGGSQVEQAGREWRDITGVLGNTAILAFVAQGVIDPTGWAKEISGTVGAVANKVAEDAAALFRGV